MMNKNILKYSFSSIYYTANSYCDQIESCEIDDDWSGESLRCKPVKGKSHIEFNMEGIEN